MALKSSVHLLCGAMFLALTCGRQLEQSPSKRKQVDHVTEANEYFATQCKRTKMFYMSHPELDTFLQKRGIAYSEPVTVDDILIISKASRECKSRIEIARETFLRWTKHAWIGGDFEDEALGITPYPGMSSMNPHDVRFGRHLITFMAWLWEAHTDVFDKYKYFFVIDDDTWVNLPLVVPMVSRYPPDLKVMFAHLIVDRNAAGRTRAFNDTGGLAWAGLGAGLIFTRAAMKAVAPELLKSCPWKGVEADDVLLSRCCVHYGVAQIHSEIFDGHDQGRHGSAYTPFEGLATLHGLFKRCKEENIGHAMHIAKEWFCTNAHR